MFNRMNRRLYHFLRIWFTIIGVILVILSLIAVFGMFLAWVDNTWGPKGFFAGLIGSCVIIGSAGVALTKADNAVQAEREEQARIERSLKRDWTR